MAQPYWVSDCQQSFVVRPRRKSARRASRPDTRGQHRDLQQPPHEQVAGRWRLHAVLGAGVTAREANFMWQPEIMPTREVGGADERPVQSPDDDEDEGGEFTRFPWIGILLGTRDHSGRSCPLPTSAIGSCGRLFARQRACPHRERLPRKLKPYVGIKSSVEISDDITQVCADLSPLFLRNRNRLFPPAVLVMD